jgi:hypothetical protein
MTDHEPLRRHLDHVCHQLLDLFARSGRLVLNQETVDVFDREIV